MTPSPPAMLFGGLVVEMGLNSASSRCSYSFLLGSIYGINVPHMTEEEIEPQRDKLKKKLKHGKSLGQGRRGILMGTGTQQWKKT